MTALFRALFGKSTLGRPAYGPSWAQVRHCFSHMIGCHFSHATCVDSDQVRYNFYVPPVLFDTQHSQTSSFAVPSKPVTPFPGVVKYLPPDRAAEAPKTTCSQSRAVLQKPHPHAHKMLTIYGENFSKLDPVHVYFGSEPSPYVEVRCTEVLGALPPDSGPTNKRRPIILVRPDGVILPSNVMYP